MVPRRAVVLALVAGCAEAARSAPAMAPMPIDATVRPAEPVAGLSRAVYLGAARAGQRLVLVGERGLIALSDDEGAHWRQARVPVSATLTAVQFVTPTVGWAVGHAGVVLKTLDGGERWVCQLDGRTLAHRMLEAARQRCAAAPADAHCQRQVLEAQRLVAEGADKPLLDLCFVDERCGWLIGAYNLMLRTDDGGTTWQALSDRLYNPRALHLYAMARQGRTLYLAGEQGLLLRSDDEGQHFQRLALPYAGSLFTVVPLGTDGLLAAGLRGNAFRSDDRGGHWRRLEGASPVSFIAGLAGDGDTVQLLNQAGERYALAGDRLKAVARPDLPPVAGAVRLKQAQWLMLTMQGLVRQPAGGA